MRRSFFRRATSEVAATVLAAPAYALLAAPGAAAFTPPPENGQAIVANQNAGCANDQQVVVATPKTNGAFVSTLNKPASVVGMLNDAKPFDHNRKVVAIWGEEPQAGHLGGVGIYDRTATPAAWTTAFPLPSGWVEASAAASATEVWVKVAQGSWTLLTYSSQSGKWGKAMNVSSGTKVIFKATRADGSWGYSPIYSWLQ
jgi:hypothetical protein